MTTPPPGPYAGAPVPSNPYAGAPDPANPYATPAGPPAGVPPQGGHPQGAHPQGGHPQGPYAQAPYPQQGGHPQGQPPQGGYPQSPYVQGQQAGYPGQHPGQYPGAPAPGCRACGSPEAVNMTVRAHVGVLVLMRFHRVDGPFCRQCGRAMVRAMTTKTLCQGWWSPVSLVVFTPFTLIWNLIAATRFSKLPDPRPAPGRQSLEEGPPVHARPLAYVAILPLLWAVWVISHIIADVAA
ncbi:hypothetical protein ACIRP0_04170 [Streptomyces sp. NPDC101733]|uniref:hypothetical protein n=1 Tax=unclassified Streptomyces TaxID=2593676 RepID=UPI00380FD14B